MKYKNINRFACNLISILNIALFLMVWMGFYNDYCFDIYKTQGVCFSVLLFVVIYAYLCKLYKAYRMERNTILEGVISQIIALGISDLILYVECCLIFNQYVNILPGLITYCAQVGISAVLLLVFKRIFIHFNVPQRTVLVYGSGLCEAEVKEYICKINAKHTYLFQIMCVVEETESISTVVKDGATFDTLMLYEVSEECKAQLIQHCIRTKKNIFFTPSVQNIIVSHCESRHYIDSPLLKYDFLYIKRSTLVMKRVQDILISLIGIILTLPIMLLITIAIKIEDGGTVIYKQKRCTLNGREFYVYKFRSMIEDAEKDGFIPCVANDSRITHVGNVIRKIRMDELPQLFNVLLGHMSLVGPRPERVEHIKKYTEELPEFVLRSRVKAGLTGYAQVYGKYNTSAADKLKLDMMYIEKLSIIEDFKLILLTIKIIFISESTEGFAVSKSQEIASTKDELSEHMKEI